MRSAVLIVAAILAALTFFGAVVAREAYLRGYAAGVAACPVLPRLSAPIEERADETLVLIERLIDREMKLRQLTFSEDDF